jgi:hypothetical protein
LFVQLEELVDQFIPSDPSWKGWVKMAFHQPLFEVFPVARELISKTKRIASKSSTRVDHPRLPPKPAQLQLPQAVLEIDGTDSNIQPLSRSARITSLPDTVQTNSAESGTDRTGPVPRPRVFSIFRRNINNS